MNASIYWVDEAAIYAMIRVAFLAASAGIHERCAVSVTLINDAVYLRGFVAASTAAGGLRAPVIPPSMLFVIYGVLAQIPIGDMFLAGIITGLKSALAFFIVIALVGLHQKFPKGRRMNTAEMRAALPAVLILLSRFPWLSTALIQDCRSLL